jgi:hypothetical protein
LRPGTLQLLLTGSTRLLRFEFNPAQARRWIDNLLRLAYLMEGPPTPTKTAQLSSLELSATRMRRQSPYLARWVGVGMLVFFLVVTLCTALMIAGVSFLDM